MQHKNVMTKNTALVEAYKAIHNVQCKYISSVPTVILFLWMFHTWDVQFRSAEAV